MGELHLNQGARPCKTGGSNWPTPQWPSFPDVPDPAQATRIVMRLCLAALLGGMLGGWEREAIGKAAGVRTHMLVCMGSAMFVMIALQTGAQANEASRVMQGVIAGGLSGGRHHPERKHQRPRFAHKSRGSPPPQASG